MLEDEVQAFRESLYNIGSLFHEYSPWQTCLYRVSMEGELKHGSQLSMFPLSAELELSDDGQPTLPLDVSLQEAMALLSKLMQTEAWRSKDMGMQPTTMSDGYVSLCPVCKDQLADAEHSLLNDGNACMQTDDTTFQLWSANGHLRALLTMQHVDAFELALLMQAYSLLVHMLAIVCGLQADALHVSIGEATLQTKDMQKASKLLHTTPKRPYAILLPKHEHVWQYGNI